ncbi:hypothetical protein OFC37_33255, partial [Escherichia coli]|nr:hypothetical protein [Escherichia coli]
YVVPPASPATIIAAGITDMNPAYSRAAKGNMEITLPKGKTEYQLPLKGTNSFNQEGGGCVRPVFPFRKLPAMRKV